MYFFPAFIPRPGFFVYFDEYFQKGSAEKLWMCVKCEEEWTKNWESC